MRSVTLILGCCLVLILSKGDWNELTGHPKDRGKDRPNSRTNSLQPREDDADQTTVRSLSVTAIDCTIKRPPAFDRPTPANDHRFAPKRPKLLRKRPMAGFARPDQSPICKRSHQCCDRSHTETYVIFLVFNY
jgi:hypothetical protein